MKLYVAEILMAALLLSASTAQGLELQGHRGARGLLPENTLPAFARALSIGVSTLELDVAMTRDKVVVVSHNPRLNTDLTRGPDGRWLTGATPAIRELSAAELATYDVGRLDPDSRYARRFKDQAAVDGTRIPRLMEVFDLVKKSGNTQVRFNIETKLYPNEPELTWPVKDMVDAVIAVIRKAGMSDRVVLQSFDWRSLIYAQQIAPEIPTSYLSVEQRWLNNIESGRAGTSPWTADLDIDDFQGSLPQMIAKAGGAIWSPYHKEVDARKIAEAHDLGLKVIVWTVNDTQRAAELIEMGVDGIISDYPDRIRQLMSERGMKLPVASAVIQ